MSENDIMKISDTIIRIAQPQKLLLFGSGATGAMNSESDLDFLVVTEHCNDEDVEVRRELYRQHPPRHHLRHPPKRYQRNSPPMILRLMICTITPR